MLERVCVRVAVCESEPLADCEGELLCVAEPDCEGDDDVEADMDCDGDPDWVPDLSWDGVAVCERVIV